MLCNSLLNKQEQKCYCSELRYEDVFLALPVTSVNVLEDSPYTKIILNLGFVYEFQNNLYYLLPGQYVCPAVYHMFIPFAAVIRPGHIAFCDMVSKNADHEDKIEYRRYKSFSSYGTRKMYRQLKKLRISLNGTHGEATNEDDVKTCWNCGGDHVVKDCKKPQDKKLINKNRKQKKDFSKTKVHPNEDKPDLANSDLQKQPKDVIVERGSFTPSMDLFESWNFMYKNDNYEIKSGSKLWIYEIMILIFLFLFGSYMCFFHEALAENEHGSCITIVYLLYSISIFNMVKSIYENHKRRDGRKYLKVAFVEWVEDKDYLATYDNRHDSHSQGKINHNNPIAAWVSIEYSTISKKTGLPKYKCAYKMISFELLSQFLAGEKIMITNNHKDNYARVSRTMRNMCTVNYDRFHYLSLHGYNPDKDGGSVTGEELLGNTVGVAMLWSMANTRDSSKVFGAHLRALN